ncbi:MAG: CheR family methyltransferase [Pseudomonadota bacterium]
MVEREDQQKLLERFRRLITGRIGITIPGRQDALLTEVLKSRTRIHRLPSPGDYLFCLETGMPPGTGDEWAVLSEALTIGESYFFRDKGHFSVFRESLFPDLIERRRSDRRLNIWSAGCASGEEPYSLAILLDAHWPELRDWDVRILGTDINPKALAAAARGEYGPWAFRGFEGRLRDDYFDYCNETWRVVPAIRARVEFQTLNLVGASSLPLNFTSPGFDLIVCRNVFIYFEPETVEQAAGKLAAALAPGGYLVAGHGEIPLIKCQGLETVRYSEAIVFRRPSRDRVEENPLFPGRRAAGARRPAQQGELAGTRINLTSKHPRPRPAPPRDGAGRPSPLTARLGAADENRLRDLLRQGKNREIVDAGEKLLAAAGGDASADLYLLLAEAQANLGKLDLAEELCRSAMARDGFAAGPHWILSQAALERGRLEEAKVHLRKVIYLDRKHVAAFLELAGLYEEEKNHDKARKMREAALALLEALPPAARVEHYDDWDGGLLADKIRRLIK